MEIDKKTFRKLIIELLHGMILVLIYILLYVVLPWILFPELFYGMGD